MAFQGQGASFSCGAPPGLNPWPLHLTGQTEHVPGPLAGRWGRSEATHVRACGDSQCHGTLPRKVQGPLACPSLRDTTVLGPWVCVYGNVDKQLHNKANTDRTHLIFVKSITNDLLILKKEK